MLASAPAMRIVVTGASSFVGRWVAKHLCDAGAEVTATYRRANARTQALQSECPGVALAKLDLARAEGFFALPESVDAVVHMAGVSAMPDIALAELLACNVDGTRNVLDYAFRAGASRLVMASTMSVYGEISDPIVTEKTPIFEPDAYGASKYLAERMLAAEGKRLPSIAIRLPGVLGPGAHRAWLPELVRRLRNGQKVTVYNPDGLFNNAVHVEDLGAFVGRILRAGWEGFHAFPVAAAGKIRVRELTSLAIERVGCGSVVFDVLPRRSFLISSEYAVRQFQYEPSDIRSVLLRYLVDADATIAR